MGHIEITDSQSALLPPNIMYSQGNCGEFTLAGSWGKATKLIATSLRRVLLIVIFLDITLYHMAKVNIRCLIYSSLLNYYSDLLS